VGLAPTGKRRLLTAHARGGHPDPFFRIGNSGTFMSPEGHHEIFALNIPTIAGAATTLPVFSRVAKAQAYPTRPITIIDSCAAGGPTGSRS
jgi:hypothetical protein